jgi:SM-20-related protein
MRITSPTASLGKSIDTQAQTRTMSRTIACLVALTCCCCSRLLFAEAFQPASQASRINTARGYRLAHVNEASRQAHIHTRTTLFVQAPAAIPRLSDQDFSALDKKKYLVVPDFIDTDLQDSLRQDVYNLRKLGKFQQARIGEGTTNELNTQIRIAETCFIGNDKLQDVPLASRTRLYEILDQVRSDLMEHTKQPLDNRLTELLYAYYPQGGYYRRHRDAVPGSTSTLREYSLLLYLNKDWQDSYKGALRVHFDSGGDELPKGQEPNFVDVSPKGGTLVVFSSDALPHEVLDTQMERIAVVGWYNRPVSVADLQEVAGSMNPMRLAMLGVAATLVMVGLVQILASG